MASSQAAQACYNGLHRGHSRQSVWNSLLYVWLAPIRVRVPAQVVMKFIEEPVSGLMARHGSIPGSGMERRLA